MLSNELTNNGHTVTSREQKNDQIYGKMSLTHKPLIVMIYIAGPSNAFIGQRSTDDHLLFYRFCSSIIRIWPAVGYLMYPRVV